MYEIETIEISSEAEMEESTFVSPINDRRLKKEKVEKMEKKKPSFSVPVTNNTFATCRNETKPSNINIYKKHKPTSTV